MSHNRTLYRFTVNLLPECQWYDINTNHQLHSTHIFVLSSGIGIFSVFSFTFMGQWTDWCTLCWRRITTYQQWYKALKGQTQQWRPCCQRHLSSVRARRLRLDRTDNYVHTAEDFNPPYALWHCTFVAFNTQHATDTERVSCHRKKKKKRKKKKVSPLLNRLNEPEQYEKVNADTSKDELNLRFTLRQRSCRYLLPRELTVGLYNWVA